MANMTVLNIQIAYSGTDVLVMTRLYILIIDIRSYTITLGLYKKLLMYFVQRRCFYVRNRRLDIVSDRFKRVCIKGLFYIQLFI